MFNNLRLSPLPYYGFPLYKDDSSVEKTTEIINNLSLEEYKKLIVSIRRIINEWITKSKIHFIIHNALLIQEIINKDSSQITPENLADVITIMPVIYEKYNFYIAYFSSERKLDSGEDFKAVTEEIVNEPFILLIVLGLINNPTSKINALEKLLQHTSSLDDTNKIKLYISMIQLSASFEYPESLVRALTLLNELLTNNQLLYIEVVNQLDCQFTEFFSQLLLYSQLRGNLFQKIDTFYQLVNLLKSLKSISREEIQALLDTLLKIDDPISKYLSIITEVEIYYEEGMSEEWKDKLIQKIINLIQSSEDIGINEMMDWVIDICTDLENGLVEKLINTLQTSEDQKLLQIAQRLKDSIQEDSEESENY